LLVVTEILKVGLELRTWLILKVFIYDELVGKVLYCWVNS